MIKKLSKYIKGFTLETVLTPLFTALEVLCEVAIPLFMADLIDKGLETGDMNFVIKMGIIMLVTAMVSLLFGILGGKLGAKASAGFAYNLRKGMYGKIQDFSFSNIDKFSTGSLVTRMTTDTSNVQMAFQMFIRILVRAPFMLVIATIMAVRISSQLSVIFLIAIPVLAIIMFLLMSAANPIFRTMFKKYDRMNTVVQEDLIGIRAVKGFVREDNEINKFNDISREVLNFSVRAEKIIVWAFPIMMFVMYACTLSIYWFGGKLIAFGSFTAGGLMSFITYTSQILISLMMVAMILVMTTMAKASGQRIVEVLGEPLDIKNPENPVMEVKNGDVEFEDMSFSYKNDLSNACLTDINLKIKSGETIGLFGATGSSKSTLVQLIPRLYDATKGAVKVAGVNVKDYDLKVLRDNVAMVLQKNVLFSGTIKENLKWGNENASDEEIISACKIAACDGFINTFDKGYDTYLEQGGVNLSGGQKQRICIARALIKNPKILILDDSTSAVDTATDAEIRAAFKDLLPTVTKIIIAQRVSSLESCDKIIVLDEGKISAFGTNEELLKTSPIYKEIYDSQNSEGGNE